MARNRAVNEKPEDSDSGDAQPYGVELNLLKSAHVAFLKKRGRFTEIRYS